MSDLVKRLRDWAQSNGAPIWTEAADRIEQLERELAEYDNYSVTPSGDLIRD